MSFLSVDEPPTYHFQITNILMGVPKNVHNFA